MSDPQKFFLMSEQSMKKLNEVAPPKNASVEDIIKEYRVYRDRPGMFDRLEPIKHRTFRVFFEGMAKAEKDQMWDEFVKTRTEEMMRL